MKVIKIIESVIEVVNSLESPNIEITTSGTRGPQGPRGGGFNAHQIVTISESHLIEKKISLASVPEFSETVMVFPYGGISQRYGVDYVVSGNELNWNGLGLDNFLEVNDVLVVRY